MDLRGSELRAAEFVAVDVETNGRAGEDCEITEVGAVLVGGGELHDELESLVRVDLLRPVPASLRDRADGGRGQRPAGAATESASAASRGGSARPGGEAARPERTPRRPWRLRVSRPARAAALRGQVGVGSVAG